MEFLFGLDMLCKHQCSTDLKDNVLRVGGGEVVVPFLQEKDIPRNFLNEEKQLKEASSSVAQGSSGSAAALTNAPTPSGGQSSGPARGGPTQGPKFEAKVGKLIELGFSREAVVQALKFFYGNEEAAAGYLF